jgi:hypothetical protein
MPAVMTTAGSIKCAHGATAALSSSDKLKVSGQSVLLKSDVDAWSFDANCAQKDASSGQVQCSKIVSVTGGVATKLKVGGTPVLLASFAAQSNGKPDASVAAQSAGQSKLSSA